MGVNVWGCTRTVGYRVILQRDTQSPKTGSLPGGHVDLLHSGRGSVMTSYYFFLHPEYSVYFGLPWKDKCTSVLVSCTNRTGDSQLFNTSVYWE